MPFKTDTATVRTIGIDTGKNTLHMIGLDEKGTIVLREKVTRGQTRLVNAPQCRNRIYEFTHTQACISIVKRGSGGCKFARLRQRRANRLRLFQYG